MVIGPGVFREGWPRAHVWTRICSRGYPVAFMSLLCRFYVALMYNCDDITGESGLVREMPLFFFYLTSLPFSLLWFPGCAVWRWFRGKGGNVICCASHYEPSADVIGPRPYPWVTLLVGSPNRKSVSSSSVRSLSQKCRTRGSHQAQLFCSHTESSGAGRCVRAGRAWRSLASTGERSRAD